ncbi:MAG: 50S ribosomal protein L32 [Candidatus Paceibacterota bacterium]|jgi:large subunit ribosomal protein L32
MAVPKWNTTSSKRDKRRANIKIVPPTLSKCPKCGRAVLPHTVCNFCGFYKGKEAINIMAKLERKEKKIREKEIKAKEMEKNASKPLSAEEMSAKK